MELEFHISPAPQGSRPHSSGGTSGTSATTALARAVARVTVTGSPTASAASGITPSRQQRISYRKILSRAAVRLRTGPVTATPRSAGSPEGTGVCSMVNRPSGRCTSMAAW